MKEINEYSSDNKVHDKQRLKELQALPLERKIMITQTRLFEWYNAWNNKCYVSFSGGKDSTVLTDLAAQVCKSLNCKLILWFSDTGLEYPEIKTNIDTVVDYIKNKYQIEVELIKDHPKDKNGKRITFRRVIEEYGYPIISKEVARDVGRYQKNGGVNTKTGEETYSSKLLRGAVYLDNGQPSKFNKQQWFYLTKAPFKISNLCCDVMKKRPAHQFNKERKLKPIIATMAEESVARKVQWIQQGCNSFDSNDPSSKPMSFWTEQDVLHYIKKYNIPLASVYGEIKQDTEGGYYTTGVNRTGCIFCAFGCHLEKEPNRFQQLKETHPKLYNYCMKPWNEGGLGMDEVLNYINVKH